MSNFIDDYVDYAGGFCDAPVIYHKMMARALIAMTGRNKVFYKLGDTEILLNLWMIFIGLSSNYRKSTSIKIAMKIMNRVDPNYRFPGQFSPEEVYPFLSKQHCATLIADEFKTFAEILKKDYMSGGQGMLTSLYDVPEYDKKQLTKGKVWEVRYPIVNIYSATTLRWLLDNISKGDIEGGYLARFLTIYAKTKEKMIDDPQPADENRKNDLVRQLHDISDFIGVKRESVCYDPDINGDDIGAETVPVNEPCSFPMVFALEAKDEYRKFMRSIDEEMNNDSMAMPFISRMSIYLIKFSMIEALNEFSREIKLPHLQKALELVEWVHGSIKDLCNNEFTFTDHAKESKVILDIIRSSPVGVTLTELKKCGVPLARRDSILKEFEQYNLVDVIERRSPGACRPTTWFVAKENKI